MKEFEFKIHSWLEGASPIELAVTNNFLSILVSGEIISDVFHQSNKSTANGVYLPLYPIAEWIAANWWRLLFECNRQRGNEDFRYCHNLSFSGEGYFLPDLSFLPETDVVNLEWKKRSINNGELQFLGQGQTKVPFDDIQSEFASFIQIVIERLETLGIQDTPLQKDWEAIRKAYNDQEEKDFCIACAQLGIDPYVVTEEQAQCIIDSHEILHKNVDVNEFFNAVSMKSITESTEWLAKISNDKSIKKKANDLFREIKERIPVFNDYQPWKRGYKEAQWVRANFFSTNFMLNDFYSMIEDTTHYEDIPFDFCMAVTKTSDDLNPTFIHPGRVSHFHAGRLLGNYIHSSENTCKLMTKLYTPEQKYSRAFAAELIAPAESLRNDLKGKYCVCDDDIVELSQKYQINDSVIRHQIENHKLAEIA